MNNDKILTKVQADNFRRAWEKQQRAVSGLEDMLDILIEQSEQAGYHRLAGLAIRRKEHCMTSTEEFHEFLYENIMDCAWERDEVNNSRI